MASSEIPPFLRAAIMRVGQIGYRAISAGISAGLKGLGEITEEADRRVKKGAQAAEKMSRGEEYDPSIWDSEETDNPEE